MIIIGIDPGLSNTGWGVISSECSKLSYIASGTISSKADVPIALRLQQIYKALSEAIDKYNPNYCAIEETFVNKNPLSSLKLGHARGAAMLAAACFNVPVHEYASTRVKKAVVGVGRADKNQVQQMVKLLLPLSVITCEHAADALAVAICHAGYARSFGIN